MAGLFGTLNLGASSLQAQRQGVDVAGQNLANVNNTAYSRQRLVVQTVSGGDGELGSRGLGVEAVTIQQLRSHWLDRQVQAEQSVTGYWSAQTEFLEYAQTSLGESLERRAAGAGAAASAGDSGAAPGLSDSLNSLFQAFQSVATSPASESDRGVLMSAATQVASKLNQADRRLTELRSAMDQSVTADVEQVNQLLTRIANLNQRIADAETFGNTPANELRDQRQAKLESLARIVNVDSATQPDGTLNLSIGGQLLVTGGTVSDALETYDAGGGQLLVRTASTATPLVLTGGHLQGTLAARDQIVAPAQAQLNTLASTLITEINAAHTVGYDLHGQTGQEFFLGTTAADIRLNPVLSTDPSRFQAAGVADAVGDNQIAVRLAQLVDQPFAALGNRSVTKAYAAIVTGLGESLSLANAESEDQTLLENMLTQQRAAVSGVSLDEEMTDLVRFQKAFEASARLVTTVSEMLDEVVNLKR